MIFYAKVEFFRVGVFLRIELLESIPGIGEQSVIYILEEISADMPSSKIFGHMAVWAEIRARTTLLQSNTDSGTPAGSAKFISTIPQRKRGRPRKRRKHLTRK